MESYGICSAAEKQQIKQMLHDAICVMCRNTVTHHVQLSIEALIGITVDNGEEILLVSIKELFNKPKPITSKTAASTASSSSYSSSSETTPGVLYREQVITSEPIEHVTIDDDSQEMPVAEADVSTQTSLDKHLANILTESTDIDNSVKLEMATGSARQEYDVDCSESDRCGKQYNDDTIGTDQINGPVLCSVSAEDALSKRKNCSSLPSSWTHPTPDKYDNSLQQQHSPMNNIVDDSVMSSDGDVPQDESLEEDNKLFYKALSMASDESTSREKSRLPHHQQQPQQRDWQKLGPRVFDIDSRLLPQRRAPRRRCPLSGTSGSSSSNPPSCLSSDITNGDIPFSMMYTCTLCGAQMGRLDSFKRHKRSHQVTVFAPCDICGKLFSRRDNMLSHRRRCMSLL